jgi:transcriptional regulator with XRE-family HTH domain
MSLNVHAGVGAGKFRNPWRIREYLASRGLKMADVARALNVDHSVVAKTVSGNRNHRETLVYLRDTVQVPAEYLGLPKDLT